MNKYKNIAITGAKQAGKSTLARWLLQALALPHSGFLTLPYDRTPIGPLYRLVEIGTEENRPISHRTEEGIRGIPESFETFGHAVVERAIASPHPVILLDEIGRFERTSQAFLTAVSAAFHSEKTVIAVLKQEPLAHIEAIKARSDTLLIDLDAVSREQAREILENWIKKR